MTANLQTKMTIKQAALLMNVSERSVYTAKSVQRLRPDLAEKVMAGAMSLNEAHRLATRKAKPTGLQRLITAWNAASDDQRAWFLVNANECVKAGVA